MDAESSNLQALASAANAAYYDAFERQDLAVMRDLWEPGERTICTHPGWPPIHGTAAILDSYEAIFRGPQSLQVILTNELLVVEGSMAYIAVDENVVDEQGNTSSMSGLNVFAWSGERWRMVVHHASPILSR